VDATAVPYVVVNPYVRANATGIVIGSKAVVTYQGKSVSAVVADVSGGKALARYLSLPRKRLEFRPVHGAAA
jgi:hypothetical protein